MVNVANVVNPQEQANDGLRFLIALAFRATDLSWLLHVPEIYCSNPEELNVSGSSLCL